MHATFRRVTLFAALFAGTLLSVLVVNQTMQLAQIGARIDPRLGDAIFWGILLVLGASLATPLVLILRLPSPLIPPEDAASPAFEAHLANLRRRLAQNPVLRDRALETREDVESALRTLDAQATDVTKAAASRAFVATAISQNGALDALFVLGLHARLIWDIAHTYYQRPPARELAYLYANVAATAFVAGEIDDLDVSEAMQPALSAVLGSAAGAIPGLQVASSIFVNSVISGTANAFMTLRVGILAREHSRAWVRPQRRALRRLAITQAGAMLGAITVAGAGRVSATIGRAAGKGVTDAVSSVGRRIVSAGGALKEGLTGKRGTDETPPATADAAGVP